MEVRNTDTILNMDSLFVSRGTATGLSYLGIHTAAIIV
jgi:hypothetical protein